MNYEFLRQLGYLIKQFEEYIEVNGGRKDFEGFVDWIKEVIWEDFVK